jgi:hypothetical protein
MSGTTDFPHTRHITVLVSHRKKVQGKQMSTNPKPEKEKTTLDLETLVRFLHVFPTKSLRDLNGLGTIQNRTSVQIRC